MKISDNASFPFQKKLVARCNIVKNNKQSQGSIYELGEQDSYFFKKRRNDKYWQMSTLEPIEDISKYCTNSSYKVFVIGDINDNCMGFCVVKPALTNGDTLKLIETKPNYAFKNSSPGKAKYIGETLLAFLVERAKNTQKRRVFVSAPSIDAIPFYEKCGFQWDDNGLSMPNEAYDKFIKQNEQHAGGIKILDENL